jgi:ribosomal protein S18 acetylase RimI-like enzyme
VERRNREVVGLLLGSRVSPQCGHITQVCIHPSFRRLGLGRTLLKVAASQFQRMGMTELTLTVTEANKDAVQLYFEEHYEVTHRFNAAVWVRRGR